MAGDNGGILRVPRMVSVSVYPRSDRAGRCEHCGKLNVDAAHVARCRAEAERMNMVSRGNSVRGRSMGSKAMRVDAWE